MSIRRKFHVVFPSASFFRWTCVIHTYDFYFSRIAYALPSLSTILYTSLCNIHIGIYTCSRSNAVMTTSEILLRL